MPVCLTKCIPSYGDKWFATSPKISSLPDQHRRLWQQCFGTHKTILIDFLQHIQTHAAINSETYVSTLRKLKEVIRQKKPLKDTHSLKIQHNARPHRHFHSQDDYKNKPVSSASPPAALIWLLLTFTCLDLWNTTYLFSDSVQNPEFFQNGFDAYINRWCKCEQIIGDYVER